MTENLKRPEGRLRTTRRNVLISTRFLRIVILVLSPDSAGKDHARKALGVNQWSEAFIALRATIRKPPKKSLG